MYLQFIQVNSFFLFFRINSNKLLLDATAQSLFIVLKDHKLAKVITLTPDHMKM